MNVPLHHPPGFYYHYKHDATGSTNNYAYFILGVGHHTENDAPQREKLMQTYLPLYESAYVYRNGKMLDNRPLAMAMENVEVDGKSIARFTRVTDPVTIKILKAIRNAMYPEIFD